jgi:hypothetical protein
MITKEQIDRLCELEKAATPGPWEKRGDSISFRPAHGGISPVGMWRVNQKLIAALRNFAVPLLSAARKLLEIREVCLEQGLSDWEIGEAVLKIIGE